MYGIWLLAWLMVFLATDNVRGFVLHILHTNDIHGRIREINQRDGSRCTTDNCYGGQARLKAKIDELRDEFPNIILLDAGDQFQGSMLFSLYGGQIMSHFMNVLGYDAMGLGHGELNEGPLGLKPFLDNATFPVLSCNIDVSKEQGLDSIEKSTILEVGEEKVGIIGYTTTLTAQISSPGDVTFDDEIDAIKEEVQKLKERGVNKIIGLGNVGFERDKEIAKKVEGLDVIVGGHSFTFLFTGDVTFDDEIDAIKEEVQKLKERGVNKIIGLGNVGFERDKEIAKKVEGLDVIVGGHSFTFLFTGEAPDIETPVGEYPTVVENTAGQKVLVVQDYAYGKYLGFLKVDFDDDGVPQTWRGNPIILNNVVPKDPETVDLIEKLLPAVEKEIMQIVGMSLVHLQGERTACWIRECTMGNMVTDAMLHHNLRLSESAGWSNVAIAIINSGGLVASIRKGNITTADITNVAPHGNTVDTVELSGSVLLDVLEHSASGWVEKGELFGGFLQMSGLRVTYDMRRKKGKRVVKVHALCTDCSTPEFQPLNMTGTYKVIVSSFVKKGGDGYSMIKAKTTVDVTGDVISESLLNYIEEYSPLIQKMENRIQFLQDLEGNHCNDASSSVMKASILCCITSLAYLSLNL